MTVRSHSHKVPGSPSGDGSPGLRDITPWALKSRTEFHHPPFPFAALRLCGKSTNESGGSWASAVMDAPLPCAAVHHAGKDPRFWAIPASMTRTASKPARIADDPTVPNPSPPWAGDLVRRSPKVAPNGRVRTNATQNRKTLSARVRQVMSTTPCEDHRPIEHRVKLLGPKQRAGDRGPTRPA
jgi:hypothetical protein